MTQPMRKHHSPVGPVLHLPKQPERIVVHHSFTHHVVEGFLLATAAISALAGIWYLTPLHLLAR